MILIQHGPAWRPKIELLKVSKITDGIIWDPREDSVEKISQFTEDNAINFIDPKYYYFEFEDSVKRKLVTSNELFYPSKDLLIDKEYLRNEEKLISDIENSLNMQSVINPTYYLTNPLYLRSFDERKVERLFDIWQHTIKIHQENQLKAPLFLNITFHEDALSRIGEIKDFISDIDKFKNQVEGIYLVVDRTSDNYNKTKIRGKYDPKNLSNVLTMIYALKNLGLKVIIGYTGLESFLYSMAGADYIGTGWFYSLRKFNKIQKGLEPEDGRGSMKRRYSSIKLLSEIPWFEYIDSLEKEIRSEALSHVLNDNYLDNDIIKGNIEDDFSFNDTYLQHFYAVDQLITSIEADEIEDRVKKVMELLDNSITHVAKFNEVSKIQKATDEHIVEWKDAIEQFKNKNHIYLF